MNWSEYLDEYCERTAIGFLNEPLNFFSNFAFIFVSVLFLLQRRKAGHRERETFELGIMVFVIGIGSGLFHSFATRWAKLSDIIPIAIFILAYIYYFATKILKQGIRGALVGYVLFFGLSYVFMRFLDPFYFNHSQGYFATLFCLVLLAVFGTRIHLNTAKYLRYSAVAFAAALFFRTIDPRVCQEFPFGTHFLWHILNGVTIYYALHAYQSARIAKR